MATVHIPSNKLTRALLSLVLGITPGLAWLPAIAQAPAQPNLQKARIAADYGNLRLAFEANAGQTDPRVKFVLRGPGYRAFLTAGGIILSLRPSPITSSDAPSRAENTTARVNTTLQLNLVGAAKNPAAIGEEPLPGKVNYFIGNNPAKWHRNVPTYARVRYQGIYPGVDLVYYGSQRQLEYDFELAPGADPRQIQFEVKGANQLELDAAGNLVLLTANGTVRIQTPTVYQQSNGLHVPVNGSYVVNDSTHIGFHLAGYDASKPVVIDPVLVYSTYLGGSGTDQPTGIAVDAAGNAYVAGFTDSTDFPLATLGALPSGTDHVFVAKLDPTGSTLLYADYLGGSTADWGYALTLDSQDNVYVTGATESSDFPTVGAYQASLNGSANAFLTKISADGSSLVYSTYLGGSNWDQAASIALNSSGQAYVAGGTSSTDFPTSAAYQSTASPNQGGVYGEYGFLTKFSADGSTLLYSTYLAGNTNVGVRCPPNTCWPEPVSQISGVAVDTNDNAYVAGITNTTNFPVTSGAYLTTNSAPANTTISFVSKFDSTGSSLSYSTYLYGSSGASAQIAAIAVDNSGSAYVTGQAPSDGTFPVTSTTICNPSDSFSACSYAFVTKFDPTGSTLSYSTFLGVNNAAFPQALALDQNNDAYILSSTSGTSYTLVNGIESYPNGNDLLLVEIDPVASTQLFATYLGGSGAEAPAGLAVDSGNNIYVASQTTSTDFPITTAAFQTTLTGSANAALMKIGPASSPAFSATPLSVQFASQQLGSTSASQSVILRNMGSSAMSISSITTSGDFAETDTCGTSLPAAGSCTFSVTFTPTGVGSRSGAIEVQDDAAGSPHSISLSGSATGVIATLAPTSLTFPGQQIGTSSASQSVTLTNSGNETLNISSMQLTGNFTQTNNCSAQLAASASCTINVTFAPAASGALAGSLTVNDNAISPSQTLTLTGTGTIGAPIATLNSTSISFSAQPLKASSSAKSVTLTNTGNAALSISSIQATGAFAETNNCSSSLAANASCTVSVTFTPSVSGSSSGTLTVTDNAQTHTQVVTLSGTGSDFTLSDSTTTDTVNGGAKATYQVTVSPVGGSFGSAIKLSCSGLPAQASCSFSPSSVTPNSNNATVTLTVSTTASMAQAQPRHDSRNRGFFAAVIQLQGFGLFGIFVAGSKKRINKMQLLLLLALLLPTLLLMSACAGGTGIVPQPGNASQSYTVTVTGASGSLQHSLPLTLTVE